MSRAFIAVQLVCPRMLLERCHAYSDRLMYSGSPVHFARTVDLIDERTQAASLVPTILGLSRRLFFCNVSAVVQAL